MIFSYQSYKMKKFLPEFEKLVLFSRVLKQETILFDGLTLTGSVTAKRELITKTSCGLRFQASKL